MRPLTTAERDLTEFLVRHAPGDRPVTSDDRAKWLSHVPTLQARAACGCGTCPSISLEVPDATADDAGSRVVLMGSAPDATILLFIDNDRPSYLELAPDGDTPIRAFPQPTDVAVARHQVDDGPQAQ